MNFISEIIKNSFYYFDGIINHIMVANPSLSSGSLKAREGQVTKLKVLNIPKG